MNEFLATVKAEILTMLFSFLPVIELKGGIPFGMAQGLSPIESLVFSYIGSTLPTIFLMLFVRRFFKWVSHKAGRDDIIKKIMQHSLSKSKYVKKYGFWGLLIFVAIPIPGTGVWSGSLISVFLNIRFKLAFPAIAIGNLIAGIIIATFSYGIFQLF